MLISSIKYLMVLTAGIIIGYLIFTEEVKQPVVNNELSELTNQSNSDSISNAPLVNEDFSSNNSSTSEDINTLSDSEKSLIDKLNRQITQQQNKIVELENLLQQKNSLTSASKAPTENLEQTNDNQSIETLSMKDFEDKMKNQFLNRFKGYAIELDDERLDAIKTEFNKDSSKANWNADYENNINAYIQDNDPNRLHFIDELNCNSNMCRLKVNSTQPDNWRKLFLNMTQQAWYHSITLSEKSNDPSIFIYFITQPQNID